MAIVIYVEEEGHLFPYHNFTTKAINNDITNRRMIHMEKLLKIFGLTTIKQMKMQLDEVVVELAREQVVRTREEISKVKSEVGRN